MDIQELYFKRQISFSITDCLYFLFQTTRTEFESSDFSVRRRYNDFLWLRQRLEESYTTHLVPVSLYLFIVHYMFLFLSPP